ILLEDEPDTVLVTVRDDGPGIPEGRLAQAEGEGRLGVAQSIRGRLRDIGGTAELISVPGQGTEVELSVPRAAVRPSDTRSTRRTRSTKSITSPEDIKSTTSTKSVSSTTTGRAESR
ncbi:ATP-binding protein, partial [Streptomyces sp. Tu 6176]|uniref:ATP-binding protein n=2 Tax=unclassified Streptomyces TaxID=2593676 RepID=UPI000562DFDF